ncbi:hypothetical protein FPANT_11481 [Fusarium pseudoanthophilum]|uniref:Uncharacterized protein n=1 Tax=Fusarium pseudoanthophilum TaxID=48495 RepID=A0A8H5KNF5_9HYPO|nr:hypothetical protein FPANT_11481 [Fusarium pseudoanthophilum]
MRLQRFLPQLLHLFLLADAALAQNTLQQTCSGLKNLSKCKYEFPVPYGVNVTLKTVPDRKYDECKSKEKYKKPCPTVKNPKAMCDAWKCVPGWVDTTKQVITGLEILTKKVNLCDTVRKLLGQPQGDNFIKSSDAICQCFPRIGELNATSGFKSFEQGVLSVADSKDVDQVVKARKCMNSAGFPATDDRDKVRKNLQSRAKRKVLIIEGPEINEDSYSKLMAIVKSCKPGSFCTGLQIQETISNLFTPYMAEIARQFRQGLFVPWVPLLENLLAISNDFNTAAQNIGSPFLGFKSRYDYATQTSCVELGSCDGPAVSSFFKQVGDIVNNIQLIYKMRVPDTASNLLTTYIQEAKDANTAAEELPDESTGADLFRGGEIQTVQDLFKFVPIVDRTFLLQRKIGSIVDFYAGYSTENSNLVSSTFTSLVDVSSSSSAGIEEELNIKERPANDDLLQQIIMMKTVLKRDLYDPLLAMKQAFKRYDEQIARSSFGPGKAGVVMEPSAIGYQRWTKIPKMAMPCSKQVTKTFNKSGFSKKFSFTEYYKCTVDGATAYYPKLQIPYIRLAL